jgi:hypothetical protein
MAAPVEHGHTHVLEGSPKIPREKNREAGLSGSARSRAHDAAAMAIPRRDIIDPSQPTVCHCYSRCVRRLPLLADRPEPEQPEDAAQADGAGAQADAAAAEDAPKPLPPDFWKDLLSDRIRQLVTLFAIDVLEWAVLDNHVHLVLSTHPDLVALWTDREVAKRWRTLTPDYQWRRRRDIPYSDPAHEEEIAAVLADPVLLARVRRSLADVSEFHKFLKQRIAKLANGVDDVTGHFWEGRFGSIVAADAGAIVAHMVYVALNPFRAGLSERPETCGFSSLRERIEELRRRIEKGEFSGEAEEARRKLRSLKLLPALPCDPGDAVRRMARLPDDRPNPWAGGGVVPVLEGLTLSAYLEEIDRSARVELAWKARRALPADAPHLLAMLEDEVDARSARRREQTRDRGRSGRQCVPPQPPLPPPPPPSPPPSPPAPPADLATAARYAVPLEEALSRGLVNAIGHFSGGLRAVARRAAALGRRAVWTLFDPEGGAPRRRVEATGGE